jgi:hypothetical protein
MLGEVLHNSVNQLAHAAEAAGQDRLLAQVSEKAFDQVQQDEPVGVKCSSTRGWRASQRLMAGMFMGGVTGRLLGLLSIVLTGTDEPLPAHPQTI